MATVFISFVVFMIIVGLTKKAAKANLDPNNPSPRMQKMLERLQAQQAASRRPPVQGQYTQPASGQPSGRAQTSAQLAGVLQQLLQAGQQQPGADQYPSPGRQTQYGGPGQNPAAPGQFQPAQYQPAQYQSAQYQPAQYQSQPFPPQYQQPPHHRPPQNRLPTPRGEIEKRVRELMTTGHEVAAIRLLCDEQDLGILEAQEYARGLVAPAGKPRPEPVQEETRYVGSAAFAESVFDLDRDENLWASGWVDKPEPDDRSDIDELWQTVRTNGRPSS
jgi:hypothetical protein